MRGSGGGMSKGKECSTQAVSYVSRGSNRTANYESTRDPPLASKSVGRFLVFLSSLSPRRPLASSRITSLSGICFLIEVLYAVVERLDPRLKRSTYLFTGVRYRFGIYTRTLLKLCQRESSVHSFVKLEYLCGHCTRRSTCSARSRTLALLVYFLQYIPLPGDCRVVLHVSVLVVQCVGWS